MRNNKSLLYGLGTGLIAGALLLQLMNAATGSAQPKTALKNSPSVIEMDRQQLKEAAAKYYKVFDNETVLYTQTQLEQKLKEEKDKQTAVVAAQPPVNETYIYVHKGLRASEVSDLLVKSGVITDRAAFEDYMDKQQLNNKVVDGIHVFKGAVDLPQVVANITTYPR
jgi:gas vesicle protein